MAGGYSKEKEVSLQTAKSVYSELNKDRKYKIKVVNPDGKFVQVLRNFNPHIVLNLLHGRYGEDGYIQAILETEKVKYTHSGVLSSSIAIDKEISKKIYEKHNILTPAYLKYSFLKKNKKKKILIKIKKIIGFPLVIKPINEGSSLGVKICKNFLELNRSAKNLFRK